MSLGRSIAIMLMTHSDFLRASLGGPRVLVNVCLFSRSLLYRVMGHMSTNWVSTIQWVTSRVMHAWVTVNHLLSAVMCERWPDSKKTFN